jgi:hypothetical protein
MPIHDEIRKRLAAGLDEDSLLDVTRLIATVHGNGESARPIVLHTILTVLEGTWRRWFEGYPTTLELAASLSARIVPAVNAVLATDAGGRPDEILAALDDLARAYKRCVEEFPA